MTLVNFIMLILLNYWQRMDGKLLRYLIGLMRSQILHISFGVIEAIPKKTTAIILLWSNFHTSFLPDVRNSTTAIRSLFMQHSLARSLFLISVCRERLSLFFRFNIIQL